MKKESTCLVWVFRGLLIVFCLIILAYIAYKIERHFYYNGHMQAILDYIPELKEYVAGHGELLDELVEIQSRLDENYFAINDGRIRVYREEAPRLVEDEIIADSVHISDKEKVCIDAFIKSFPEYRSLQIYPDQVSIIYYTADNMYFVLFLTNKNHHGDEAIGVHQRERGLYVEKIDETWYAIAMYTPPA